MTYGYYRVFCVIALTLCSLVNVDGQTCAKIDECTCQFEDGTIIDLKSVGSNDGSPKFLDLFGPDNYYYSYNPCYPFNQGTCQNAAACQRAGDASAFYLIGQPETADFTFDGVNAHIVYTAPGEGSGIRITDVILSCDPNAGDAFVVANGETSTQQYSFTLTSRCACPGLCGGDTPTPNPNTPTPNPDNPNSDDGEGISIGTIICIIALALIVTYITAGVAFQKLQRQASGKEVIPNVTFWQALPGLIRDGFVLTFGICKKRTSYDKL